MVPFCLLINCMQCLLINETGLKLCPIDTFGSCFNDSVFVYKTQVNLRKRLVFKSSGYNSPTLLNYQVTTKPLGSCQDFLTFRQNVLSGVYISVVLSSAFRTGPLADLEIFDIFILIPAYKTSL